MAKNAFNELWIDGFNLFYKWQQTRHLFRPGCSIETAQEKGIRNLAIALERKRSRCILFMDGGVEAATMTLHGLRIKYPGNGKKADTLMEEFARGRTGKQRILAVTSDRALAATLRRNHIQLIDCEKFIRNFLNNSSKKRSTAEYKPETMSPDEVDEWVKIFSEDDE